MAVGRVPAPAFAVNQQAYAGLDDPRRRALPALLHPTAARWPGAPTIPTRGRGYPLAQNFKPPKQTSNPPPMPKPPAHVLPTVSCRQTRPPNFTRLDVPNEKGADTTIDESGSGRPVVKLNPPDPTSRPLLATKPNDPLPDAQCSHFPMLLNMMGTTRVLHGPYWDEEQGRNTVFSKPCSGDRWYVTAEERQERRALRAKAYTDLKRYGAPEWLAQVSDSDGE